MHRMTHVICVTFGHPLPVLLDVICRVAARPPLKKSPKKQVVMSCDL